jgi:uncharacterized membrane protein YcaP (DUF421 family)
MKKEEISLGDWQRWLFGTAPPAFTLEVLLRTVLIFACMLLVMRLLGRRMKGQLSIGELAVVLTLGGIIGGALHNPEMGVLPSLVVLATILGMHRLVNWLAFKSHAVELLEQGQASRLVRDGCLELATMHEHAISQEQLFGLLRNNNIAHLGELRRVYLEANGRLSFYKLPQPRPGLSVLPRADAPPPAPDGPAHGRRVCATCGHLATPTDHAGASCPRCTAENWLPATS